MYIITTTGRQLLPLMEVEGVRFAVSTAYENSIAPILLQEFESNTSNWRKLNSVTSVDAWDLDTDALQTWWDRTSFGQILRPSTGQFSSMWPETPKEGIIRARRRHDPKITSMRVINTSSCDHRGKVYTFNILLTQTARTGNDGLG